MSYQKQEPTVTSRDGKKVHNHPAFGVVTVTRPSYSPGINLFGSDLSHQNAISITIQTAKLERDLNRDWVFPTGTVLEFTMSESQWAKFVAGAGRSMATPVTLDTVSQGPLVRLPGISVPKESRKDTFNQEFKEKLDEAIGSINSLTEQLEELASGKSVSKVALKHLVANLKNKVSNLPKNMDFAVESFQEVTETVVEEAKAEIEAYYLDAAFRYGVDALNGVKGEKADNGKLTGV